LSSRIWLRAAIVLLAAFAADHAAPVLAAPNEVAVFAGGCFWCEESAFEDLPGVVSSVSGYAGGTAVNPSYEEVSTGRTGHAESAQVTFDPSKISYDKLLDVYWHNIDPTQKDGQFCDHGSQYRTVIFYANEAQKNAALASKAKLESDPRFHGRIATEIVPLTKFYPAEEYHQNYCKVNPLRYTAYYKGCGRETRLKEIWGDAAGGHK
jgi:peptide-methionine (S)-S-oxide reductase